MSTVLDHCRTNNILAGVPLATTHPDLPDCFLVAVTENRTKAQIDDLVATLKTVP